MANNAVGEAVRQGKEVLTTTLAIAAASAVLPTPFKTIDSVQISVNVGVAPAITDSVFFTWTFAAGVLTIFAWKFTSNANPTYIAGAAASAPNVTVIGRRR